MTDSIKQALKDFLLEKLSEDAIVEFDESLVGTGIDISEENMDQVMELFERVSQTVSEVIDSYGKETSSSSERINFDVVNVLNEIDKGYGWASLSYVEDVIFDEYSTSELPALIDDMKKQGAYVGPWEDANFEFEDDEWNELEVGELVVIPGIL